MINMSEKFEIKINVPMIKELVSDKIYRSDASAFREQYVNALSHGCVAYHQEYGYTDDVYVHVEFDYGLRKVTIKDNGMGMSKKIFEENFMSFGFSTVDKETNNTRSGMFGLGAISFFRIASACIVESWDRRTEERFTFMTRGTDESEMVSNCNLKEYGTQTEIFLKEHVRIGTLVEMVQTIASNYPVKTILEITNSESEQTIATYKDTDNDTYEEYQPVPTFKEYVKKQTEDRFVTLIDNDEMELYLSTVGGNRNSTYLCRIPIDISYSTGFTTYLNIKQEKIKGTDSKGRDKLQEVPKPDRDEVNEIATDYFSKVIEKACDDMIHDIQITSFDEYQTSDKRWILNGYSIDDKLNYTTHEFVQQMREPVRYRTVNGIQKRHETLLTLFGQYKTIMFHPSLHKGTFDAIDKHLREQAKKQWIENNPDSESIISPPSEFVLVDNNCDQPLTDAKAFKKLHKVKSVITPGGRTSAKGLLVRDGSWNNYRLTNDDPEENKKKYPGGLYYADDWVSQHDIPNVYSETTYIRRINEDNKVGIIVAKKAAKLYPSITTFYDKIQKAAKDGKIIRMKRIEDVKNLSFTSEEIAAGKAEQITNVNFDEGNLEIEMDEDRTDYDVKRNTWKNIKSFFEHQYGTMVLPFQCKDSLPFLKHLNIQIIFMPANLIHGVHLIAQMGNTSKREAQVIDQLKWIPQWTKWSENGSAFAWSKYYQMNGRYSDPNLKCLGDMMQYLVDIEDGIHEKPNETQYGKAMKEIILSHGENEYAYRIDFEKIFPTLYLEQRAKYKGFEATKVDKDSDGHETVYAYAKTKDGFKPMEINGQYYTIDIRPENETDYKAIIDDDGNPQMVKLRNNYAITSHNGELVFMEEMNQWS
jgi:hypothetical protein